MTDSDSRHVQEQHSATTGASTNIDDKKAEKLKKLEAWKKKQAERKRLKELEKKQETHVVDNPLPKKPILSLAQFSKGSKLIKKRSSGISANVFGDGDDDEDTARKKPRFIPTNDEDAELEDGDINRVVDQDHEDPLEAFMNNLNGDSTKVSNELNSELIDDEDGTGSANMDAVDGNEEATKLLKKLKTKKTRDIQTYKFNLKELEPLRKDFFVNTHPTDPDEAINFQVMNNIFINNKSITPVMNFYHMGLDAETISVITEHFRFKLPTPIQSQTIPAIMTGNDVIGIGKTGSGKTMCYLLGMLKHIKQQRPLSKGETGPMGVILSPTRELAIQIYETCCEFLKVNSMNAICCTGGSELQKQINDLKRGVEVIIATPGRFIDLLTLNNGKLLKTDRISFVTLDEADRLFDLGFEPQINQIMKTIRPDKQCVLFSATFPSKLQAFAVKILQKPVIIAVGNKQVVNENITQMAKVIDKESDKFNYLLNILGKQPEHSKTIIFCESQLQVDFMNRRLLGSGHSPIQIHAGLSSNERAQNLQKFKKDPNANILICTEVLSRGLDVPEVTLVILYNAARSFAQYVHSTGRTARGNTKGSAISLISSQEDVQAYILYKCMKEDELPDDVKVIALKFAKDLESGKKKISAGYGGKGLDNLDKLRDETEQKAKQKLGEVETKSTNETDHEDENEENVKEPNLDIVYNIQTDSVDKGDFNAKININDLPQDIRWIASNNATLTKIIEQTSVSVTYKGRFYPEGKEPEAGEEPKLYLLVEATREQQLFDAIDLFKSIVVSGLKKATQDRSGKFSM